MDVRIDVAASNIRALNEAYETLSKSLLHGYDTDEMKSIYAAIDELFGAAIRQQMLIGAAETEEAKA